jgi:hypothetical protein
MVGLIITNFTLSGIGNMCMCIYILCYKLEGRGLDSRWCHWIFKLT